MANDNPDWVDPTDLERRVRALGLSDDVVRAVVAAADREVPTQVTRWGMAKFWPHVRQIAERLTKPLPHAVQLAFDALEVLADDKTNVRGMPHPRLLELVNAQITKSTKGKVASVSMSTMQTARRHWVDRHPIRAR
jgi:hypothetical protein